jgi:glycosyltransferase involved in cell wall biosynthesis
MPWPLDDGGRIGLWQTVRSVAHSFDTTLVSLVPPADAEAPLPEPLRRLGIDVIRLPHRPPWTPVAVAQGVLGPWPYTLARYRNRVLEMTLRRLVAERRPVLAFINHLHLATYLDVLGGLTTVLRAHNLEHLWLARYAERIGNPGAHLYACYQARRMRRTEAELCAAFDLVLAIRDEEAEVLRRLAPRTRVEVVPVGIDLDRYRERISSQPPIVALVGSWEWAPNVDGARTFLERGWDRVRSRVGGVRLRVVGKRMPRELAQLARRVGAEAVGYVEDMTIEFAQASVLVVPLWMGAGVRVKIVEALAARLPVATTTLGAEGLGLEPGVHALFGDTPETLGDAVVQVLSSPERAEGMSEAGRQFARERFSLDAVVRRTAELCECAVRDHLVAGQSRGRPVGARWNPA